MMKKLGLFVLTIALLGGAVVVNAKGKSERPVKAAQPAVEQMSEFWQMIAKEKKVARNRPAATPMKKWSSFEEDNVKGIHQALRNHPVLKGFYVQVVDPCVSILDHEKESYPSCVTNYQLTYLGEFLRQPVQQKVDTEKGDGIFPGGYVVRLGAMDPVRIQIRPSAGTIAIYGKSADHSKKTRHLESYYIF